MAGSFITWPRWTRKRAYIAMKQYTYVKGALRFLVPLYEISTGALLALIEADIMGQLRTGAASGVATKYLAQAGRQGRRNHRHRRPGKTQLEAVANVRKLQSARAYGRDPERRWQVLQRNVRTSRNEVTASESAADAVRGVDIVTTATTSRKPVLSGADFSAGVHINAIGANHAHKRELDDAAMAKVDDSLWIRSNSQGTKLEI